MCDEFAGMTEQEVTDSLAPQPDTFEDWVQDNQDTVVDKYLDSALLLRNALKGISVVEATARCKAYATAFTSMELLLDDAYQTYLSDFQRGITSPSSQDLGTVAYMYAKSESEAEIKRLKDELKNTQRELSYSRHARGELSRDILTLTGKLKDE